MTNLTISPEGKVSSDTLVQAAIDYRCDCGATFSLALEWPENLTVQGEVFIDSVSCPKCGSPIKLRKGKYHVENFKLVYEPLTESDRSLS